MEIDEEKKVVTLNTEEIKAVSQAIAYVLNPYYTNIQWEYPDEEQIKTLLKLDKELEKFKE